MVEHPSVSHGSLGANWHHLPAYYLMDAKLVCLVVMGCTGVVILFILMPALRRRLSTVLVVLTCLTTGFLMGYSLAVPDWQVAHLDIPPEPLGYSAHSVRNFPLRLYQMRLGLHIGLTQANITLLAAPIRATCSSTFIDTLIRRGCFPEMNPKRCSTKTIAKSTAVTIVEGTPAGPDLLFTATTTERLQRAGGRRLFGVDEHMENMYIGQRVKPLHFPRSKESKLLVETEANDSLHVVNKGQSLSNSMLAEMDHHANYIPTDSSIPLHGMKRHQRACGLMDDDVILQFVAWFDERVDWQFGKMTESHREKLKRGLPSPILILSEYLSRRWDYGTGGGEGGPYSGNYDWAMRLRYAGHFSSCLLITALIVWGFSIPVQMSEPVSGAKLLCISGVLMALSAPLYAFLVSTPPGYDFRVSGVRILLQWGPCFYSSLFGGLWAATVGCFLMLVRKSFPGAISTDLDMEELELNKKHPRPIELEGIDVENYKQNFT